MAGLTNKNVEKEIAMRSRYEPKTLEDNVYEEREVIFKERLIDTLSSFKKINSAVLATEYYELENGDASDLMHISKAHIRASNIDRYPPAVDLYELEDYNEIQKLIIICAIDDALQFSFKVIVDNYIDSSKAFTDEGERVVKVLSQYRAEAIVCGSELGLIISESLWNLNELTISKIGWGALAGAAIGVIGGALTGGVLSVLMGAVMCLSGGAAAGGLAGSVSDKKRESILNYDLNVKYPELDQDYLSDGAIQVLTRTRTSILETGSYIVGASTERQVKEKSPLVSYEDSSAPLTPTSELDFSGEPCSFTDSDESLGM